MKQRDWIRSLDCPFFYEPDRKPKDMAPCSVRYRQSCGCKQDGKPTPGRRYKRSAA